MKTKFLFLNLLLLAVVNDAFAQTERIEFEAPDSYPEGIAYDRKADAFYVSSARTGTVGKVTRGGAYSVLYAEDNLKSSYGMKVDSLNNRLLVCISDANYSKFIAPSTHRKMCRLIAIDLASGKKTMDVNLAGLYADEHFANDLTIDDKGNIYITDSYADVIYKVSADRKASLFADNTMFKTKGVGLNGIVWHPEGYLLVASSGKGCFFKVDISNPEKISKVMADQFFMGADGLILDKDNKLIVVVNQGSDKIYQLESTDNWLSAKPTASTLVIDRFTYPSTAAIAGGQIWVMNAKFSELTDKNNVPSKKFAIQKAVLKPLPPMKTAK